MRRGGWHLTWREWELKHLTRKAFIHSSFVMISMDAIGFYTGNPELHIGILGAMHEPFYRIGGFLAMAAIYLEEKHHA